MKSKTGNYTVYKEKSIQGRYINYNDVNTLLSRLTPIFKLTTLGKSVLEIPINSIDFGAGQHKILMWSQMHGNEATTTKAIFDFLNFMGSDDELAKTILANCRIKIIPMLNPDGAEAYTRFNANHVDLNRDAQNLSQPESRVLRDAYTDFQPDYCFNLHDQRTIYNVGDTDAPASVSFLAPAMNEERSISKSRAISMQLIAAINKKLQQIIPNQVGRYDDSFNANCVGDTFQMLGSTTVLFEAGHYPGDYQREKTRECLFISLVTALEAIAQNEIDNFSQEDYFVIPENGKRFYDILITHAHLLDADYDEGISLGILYEEKLLANKIQFTPKIAAVFGDGYYLGHQTFNCAIPAEVEKLKSEPFFKQLF